MCRHFLFEEFDDGLRRVVSKEEVEIRFAAMYETAESRDINFPQVGIHNILHWQVKYLL